MNAKRRIPAETTVAVLMGGWSAEREVSLSSGEACAGALRRAGFNVVPIDVTARDASCPSCRTCSPTWPSTRCMASGARMAAVLPILETLQIPYTHSGVLASSLAMHKEKSKTIFREAGVPVAESKLVDTRDRGDAASHAACPMW